MIDEKEIQEGYKLLGIINEEDRMRILSAGINIAEPETKIISYTVLDNQTTPL